VPKLERLPAKDVDDQYKDVSAPKTGSTGGAGASVVDNALELPHVREPPVVVAREAEAVAVVEGVAPRKEILASRLPVAVYVRRVLLPHEPRAVVRHRPVPVVDVSGPPRGSPCGSSRPGRPGRAGV
jgi:hypothetical protein